MSTSHRPTQAFHVYDTTLRDGAQQEGLNLSVADKLTIARQLDELGVGYIEGGWPGANPKDTEFFRARPRRARPAARHARGLRRHPAGRRTRGRRPAGRGAARQRRRRSSRWSPSRTTGTSSSRCAPRSRRTSRWSATPSRHLRAEGQRVFLDAEHFFDGYRANRDYALEVLRTAYDAGAEVVALCDTNGGMLPGWVADVVHDVRRRPPACGSASTATTTPAARSPTRSPRSTPARPTCRARSTATASAPATPTWSPSSPTSSSSSDRPVLPDGLLRRGHPDRARGRRGDQRPARLAPAVRRRLGVRAQGRAARQRDQGRPEPLPAHGPGRRRQRHAAAGLATWPAARRSSSRAASSASTCPATATWSPGSPTGSRSWSRAATPSRPPTRRSSCCSSRRSRARRPSYFESSRGG